MRKIMMLAATTVLVATLTLFYPAAAAAQTTPPAAPSGLTAMGVSTSAITIAWTDNSDNETWFEIEYCAGSGCTDFAMIGIIMAGGTNATQSNLGKNKTYTYRVRAYNNAGYSAYSNTATGTTLR
jgi:predicted phage tail protein